MMKRICFTRGGIITRGQNMKSSDSRKGKGLIRRNKTIWRDVQSYYNPLGLLGFGDSDICERFCNSLDNEIAVSTLASHEGGVKH